MTKEDLTAVFLITIIVVSIGDLVDRTWFERDRVINGLIAKMKKQGRCVVCERPLEITEE